MIALYKGTSPLSSVICWMNFSDRSHASYVDSDEETEFEALIHKGVQKKLFLSDLTPGTVVDLYDIELTRGELEGLREFFTGELGSPYDYRALGGFLLRRRIEDPNAWYCSELVAAGFNAIKKPLLLRIEPFKTYPALLSYSPLLKFRKTMTIGRDSE